jgi:hypothetical protein
VLYKKYSNLENVWNNYTINFEIGENPLKFFKIKDKRVDDLRNRGDAYRGDDKNFELFNQTGWRTIKNYLKFNELRPVGVYYEFWNKIH